MVGITSNQTVKGVDQHVGKYAYLLYARELEEKIDTALMSVHYI